MNKTFAGRLPWPLSFSYGRALQQPALKAWKGAPSNVATAQALLLHRSRMNGLACAGRYSAELERKALAA
jgi:fructose-bisphosphate aldolase class I